MNWFVWFPVVSIMTSHPSKVCVGHSRELLQTIDTPATSGWFLCSFPVKSLAKCAPLIILKTTCFSVWCCRHETEVTL